MIRSNTQRLFQVEQSPGSADFVQRRPKAASDNLVYRPRCISAREFFGFFQVGAAGRHALPLKKDTGRNARAWSLVFF